ncbi:serine/threonine protein kinase [Neofusicoccum ribis]|uniref:Serine/threonine protein kinase n=1 Tax=Neofusicoccum ribis TaxID=45134 RepID=A0ABR3T763_9PEZI
MEMLKDRVEDIDDSHDEVLKPASIASLTAPDGPLHFFEKLLEELVSKLAPKDKLRKLAQPLSWPFDKKDITEMLGNLERLKTHFSLIIQNDLVQRQAQTSLALLSSLLEQVLLRTSSRTLPPEVLSLYSLHKQHGTRPTLAQITDVLKEVSSAYDALHIVVDALDECGESEDSALDFISAVLSLGSNIKLLCTSRFSSTFDVFFEDNTATRLAISAQNEDIRIFLEERIRRQSRLAKHIRADPTLEEEIITTIIEESHGM